MIALRDVAKAFHGVPALRGVSVDVREGEAVAILGPSGSGKSTLLRCVNFLERADAGSIRVGDLTVDLAGGRLKSGVNRLNISMVIGDTLLLVPSAMPLKISMRTILGDIKIDGRAEEGLLAKLEHADETYESSQDKLLIMANGIIGDTTLRRT